jgi:3-oxoacyl-[acyl-carrier-protein] synthase-1
LANIGLADLEALLATVGVPHAPLMVGLPSALDAAEEAVIREELRRSPSVHPQAALYPYGRASTFLALQQAVDLVGCGAHRFIVVGGIDSLCALDTLQKLMHDERVLGPHTEGTIPGEGAVFALVARVDDSSVDPSTTVMIEAVAEHRGQPFADLDRVSGDGLGTVFRAFRERGAARVDRVIAAHSGEGYFARSFAHAYLREIDVMPEPLDTDVIADFAGDVGAAAGTLGLAFGLYRMATAPQNARGRVLVYSESDTGELGAAIITGSPTVWTRAAVET